MLSKRNRRKLKTYKGGGPALNSYMNSKPVSAKITQEMVDAYGYPEKYIGYDVALSPSGIEKPFTISEMCELVWILQKHLDFSNLLSESNVKAIDTQLNKDIYRDIKVYINGQDVKTDSPSEDYAQFINQQFSGVSPETITQIKLLINQFALSVASDIMSISLPKYKDEHIMVQPLNSSTLETYKDIFPNINNNKIINVTHNSDNIIIDESYFTALIILKPVDPFENISDDPYEDVGVAAVFVYCDFKKDKGFFIWDKKIKPQQEQQYQQEEQEQRDLDPEQARTSINNIVLGSIGAAAVATGAVVGTLFGVGVFGGKSKKKRKTRKSIRKKRRTTRQIKTRKTRKTRTKR
jgi:hypothetical protein